MIWLEKFWIMQYVLSFPTHLKIWIFSQIIIFSRHFPYISKTFNPCQQWQSILFYHCEERKDFVIFVIASLNAKAFRLAIYILHNRFCVLPFKRRDCHASLQEAHNDSSSAVIARSDSDEAISFSNPLGWRMCWRSQSRFANLLGLRTVSAEPISYFLSF